MELKYIYWLLLQFNEYPSVFMFHWLKKKMYHLKVENYILFRGLAENLSLGGSLSDSSQGLLWRSEGGARIYRRSNKQLKNQGGEHQKITAS